MRRKLPFFYASVFSQPADQEPAVDVKSQHPEMVGRYSQQIRDVNQCFVTPDQQHVHPLNNVLPLPKARTLPPLQSLNTKPGLTAGPRRASSVVELLSESRPIEPKVMLPFIPRPGETPRRLEVERKKRIYAAQTIPDLLKKLGVRLEGGAVYLLAGDKEYKFTPESSLEEFDDDSFEERSLEEWIELGSVLTAAGNQTNSAWRESALVIPGKAHVNGEWIEGHAVAYNRQNNQWKFLPHPAEADNPNISADVKTHGIWLHRLHVYFNAEDPFKFAERLAFAHRHRAYTEAKIQFVQKLDDMAVPEAMQMASKQLKNVVNRLGDYTGKFHELTAFPALTAAYRVFHGRVQNELAHPMEFPIELQTQSRVERKQKIRRPADLPPYNFKESQELFRSNTFHSSNEVNHLIRSIKAENLKLLNSSLFVLKFNKVMRLEEFDHLQSHHMQQFQASLRDNWYESLRNILKVGLNELGKGWFNVRQKDIEIYRMSKLSRFMKMVKFMMQDTLRFLLMNSLESFVDVFRRFHANATAKGSVSKSNDTASRRFLLNMELLVRGGQVASSLEQAQVEKMMYGLFEKSFTVLQNLADLEPHIVDQIFWVYKPTLEIMEATDSFAQKWKNNLKNVIADAFDLVNQSIADLRKYEPRIQINSKQYIMDYEKQNPTLENIQKEIVKLIAENDKIQNEIPRSLPLGIFNVNLEPVRSASHKDLGKATLEMTAKRAKQMALSVDGTCKAIFARLKEKPASIEDLVQLREWMATIPEIMRAQQTTITDMVAHYLYLEEQQHDLSRDEVSSRWAAFGWVHKIEERLEIAETQLKSDETFFLKSLRSDQEVFGDKMRVIKNLMADVQKPSDVSRMREMVAMVNRIDGEVKDLIQNVQVINMREKLFNLDKTNSEDLLQLTKDFEPFKMVWIMGNDWTTWRSQWMDGQFHSIDAEEVEKNLNNAFKVIVKCMRSFKGSPDYLQLATDFKGEIDAFKVFLPLIQALRNPGMRDRHWDKIVRDLALQIDPSMSELTLTKLVEMKIVDKLDAITKIGDVAAKEYSIETALNKMEADWSNLQFEVLPYRETGTCIVKLSEDIVRLLDDHITMTQSMNFSPFKKVFAERIQSWNTQLRLIQDILDVLMECQRAWLYLEPVFTSDDIKQQLPTESKRFFSADRSWRRVMSQARQNTLVVKFCSEGTVLNALTDAVRTFESISKALTAYLDSKRLSFPRFFFLSDDELLQILSQTKDPRSVQPHLPKCFENINKLIFADDMTLQAMKSGEGEVFPFSETFIPTGNVEQWLLKVESVMKASVSAMIKKAIVDYLKCSRTDWVQKWPGQVVIAGSQVYWTMQVAQAIEQNSLKDLAVKLEQQLEDLVVLVRQELPPLTRMILSDLIVIEVHARDVVQRLLQSGVQRSNDFEWISQLRYYWEDDSLKIKILNASFNYGCEYLGNTGRLVITPLTDRCYLTLCMAMSLNMGGSPAGPAGTGKTETVKDLAKALAKQCVVFNCSDQLDYLAMAKFFKGLASAGAWSCFDEFNRINIENLSVIATQIASIQKATAARVEKFYFEGVELKLDPTCAIFITMNPGYAGRTELPDNLKALFRPVAMMIPDYALIAEISLFSFGFTKARVLAQKLVATFRLSSEQLSTADHYDFGMRSVKAVVASAGNIKRESPAMPEDKILLRSLIDCNLPKFLADDVPLFEGIISDLFPGVDSSSTTDPNLLSAISSSCCDSGLQAVDIFIKKCVQMYDTTRVRHGMMLVGPSGGGKTACARTLAKALTSLSGKDCGPFKYDKVQINTLNPKAITMGRLYGEFDPQTREWSDGIISSLVRAGIEENTPDQKWYIFDGPVDAIWIESMNTVLDDNKKLCLTSGEIIKLSPTQKMIFEVDNLAFASPATVSRCGMVYLEPSALGYEPMLVSWIQTKQSLFETDATKEEFKTRVESFIRYYFEASVDFIRKSNTKEIVSSSKVSLFHSFLRIVESFMTSTIRPIDENNTANSWSLEFLRTLEGVLVFSLIWSVGAIGDQTMRSKYDSFLRQMIEKRNVTMKLPSKGTLYDYRYDSNTLLWTHWMSGSDDPSSKLAADSIVTTVDTVRYSYIFDLLIKTGHHLMFIGPTGTGKTAVIKERVGSLDKNFSSLSINFSARTNAAQVQKMIDDRLSKRRKGVYGPSSGSKMVVFIDDLNMPTAESTGAQPPIELLRQWMDHQGWYDRQQVGRFNQINDLIFVAACGLPGGGRSPTTPRLLRHFNQIACVDIEEESLTKIYSTYFNQYLTTSKLEDFKSVTQSLVAASVEIYNKIRTEFLPTPSKPHYTFNLRDLSRVFRGILLADPKQLLNETDLFRLWYHECMRVFSDRLVDNQDRALFKEVFKTQFEKHIKSSFNDTIGQQLVLFGDFTNPAAENKSYQTISDMKKLVKVVEESMDDYNSTSTAPLKLVLFQDALEHLTRVCRIMRQPQGHALLLGVGGSGRQSLAKLAIFIQQQELFSIEVSKNYGMNEWREDLKKVLFQTGIDDLETAFLLSDGQLISEACLEDINNILNSGDVPNLFAADDLEKISTAMKPIAAELGIQTASKDVLYSMFVNRSKNKLKVVLCMSPIGEVFRTRLRMFPSLVNCCTIDWFGTWPDEALRSVAAASVTEIQDLGNEDVIDGVIDQCVFMHESVRVQCVRYKTELSRNNYVTPKSYLELIALFRENFQKKKTEIWNLRQRLATGLEKLLAATREVEVLKKELADMQPLLLKASEETESTMTKILADKQTAEKIREVIAVEEASATKKAEETKAIADDAQRDLDEALPALEAAVESLKCLTKNDVIEVRSMQRPPDGVKMVMEAICIMKGVKGRKIDGANGKKVEDYWDAGKALLTEPGKFLESLFTFDKDNIPEATIQKIKPYIDNPDFLPAAIQRVSKAATSMCQWVRAMEKYYWVSRSVEPKRERLRGAQETLDVTMKNLAVQRAKMAEIEANIQEMEKNYSVSVAKKEELSMKVNDCNVKLIRAEKLIVGLSNERQRWAETVKTFDKRLHNLVGDILLAIGAVAYLGVFTAEFRQFLIREWQTNLHKNKIGFSEVFSLLDILGDSLKIRQWEIFGLPKDYLSCDNAVIVEKSRRWPLFIDPQGQANKWVRNMESANGLDIIKLSDKDFLRTLENCIRFGKPCLLENIGEKLDPALDPVLMKQTFKSGNMTVIRLGDAIVPFHSDFRFFMTTKLPNPHYSPEITANVTLINFTLAAVGLEDQLLAMVVACERADLEEAKNALMISGAQMRQQLQEIEDRVLLLVSSTQGSPLDDERLIDTLAASKKTAEEIQEKVKIAEKTERDIDQTRSLYSPVAIRGRILFFCIIELTAIDPMYQYSLGWFMNLFKAAIARSEKNDVVAERVKNLNEYFTYSLFSNVCRSLFEKHKNVFAFLLASRILMNENLIDMNEWKFLVGGYTSKETPGMKNPVTWLSARVWNDLCLLSTLPAFSKILSSVSENADQFHQYYDCANPERAMLPSIWNTDLTLFQRLVLLRCFRPDRFSIGAQNFVATVLGAKFVEPTTTDLSVVFKESNSTTPIIFVLSSGADPAASFNQFAEDMRFSKRTCSISLGQGQGPRAEALLEDAVQRGLWVLLQNCHLSPSWMPSLDRIIDGMTPDKVHRDFRLWLTSMPSDKFPVTILQNGLKITMEPPSGVRANILRTFSTFTEDIFTECTKIEPWKKLLFSLCMFHAVVQERRKFGPLGWNIPYEFSEGDLRVCVKQLKIFLDEYDTVPFKVLKYTTSELHYGGRVTDDWDRRLITSIIEDYYNEDVLKDGYKFSQSHIYKSIAAGTLNDYLNTIRSFPLEEPVEIFCLDANASITSAEKDTFTMLNTLVSLMPKSSSSSGAKSRDQQLAEIVNSLLERLPKPFDLEDVQRKYPTNYLESLSTVLVQEVARFNKLLLVMQKMLKEAALALQGLVVMSEPLEVMCNSLFVNAVPSAWAAAAYPSLKPLSSWFQDLLDRVTFIEKWILNGQPSVFWISGFFFPQAFLTAILQNYARKNKIPIDLISFDFQFLTQRPEDIKEGPTDGCYVSGLFIEGACWDATKSQISLSRPKELYAEMPVIWFLPKKNRDPPKNIYRCPVYKTLQRAGTLSTTGHSTNFVVQIDVPSDKPEGFWTKRSVALFCALNY